MIVDGVVLVRVINLDKILQIFEEILKEQKVEYTANE